MSFMDGPLPNSKDLIETIRISKKGDFEIPNVLSLDFSTKSVLVRFFQYVVQLSGDPKTGLTGDPLVY